MRLKIRTAKSNDDTPGFIGYIQSAFRPFVVYDASEILGTRDAARNWAEQRAKEIRALER